MLYDFLNSFTPVSLCMHLIKFLRLALLPKSVCSVCTYKANKYGYLTCNYCATVLISEDTIDYPQPIPYNKTGDFCMIFNNNN